MYFSLKGGFYLSKVEAVDQQVKINCLFGIKHLKFLVDQLTVKLILLTINSGWEWSVTSYN